MTASTAVVGVCDASGKQPFRFLDLPRELRDRIYEFALYYGTIRISGGTGKPGTYKVDRGNKRHVRPRIVLTCRQIYQEATRVFYGINTFDFEDVPAAFNFLRDRPEDAVRSIRYLQLSYRHNNDSDQGQFNALCALLQWRCPLRELKLTIHTADVRKILQDESNLEKTQYQPIPAWVNQVLQVKNLHRLHVHWNFGSRKYIRTALAAARLMRSSMLQTDMAFSDAQGIQVRLRHVARVGRQQIRWGELNMMITKDGESELERKRRVRVLPHSWCNECGAFEGTLLCDCIHQVSTACLKSFESKCRSCHRCGRPGTMYRGEQHQLPAILKLDPDDTSTTPVGEDVWDSRRWGGKALKDYLPNYVTEDDFHKAKELANVGVTLVPPIAGDYANSDFGDTDSLLSVHGWSDDEDGE
ncbi:hypothetical protein BU26DRAFT_610379 [Trematosphaeria pertusa]|uniref:DUF7730 domain-containing protein n=1 Tax=Trematosphaeria pertusa TaxID=390896 RepID=A0A6A6HVF6_9PLEO|nr:uncharacterized protein BU26DRAFT_610379 [Trematosphaeria pertusa]KAF2242001.1 hypothetical protein BU26DRAFT_610379 [Trematosphaeria pertusa]